MALYDDGEKNANCPRNCITFSQFSTLFTTRKNAQWYAQCVKLKFNYKVDFQSLCL